MAHRKWKETKQQPSMLPGPAVPGCSLVSFHFLRAILCPQAVGGVESYVAREGSKKCWWRRRVLLVRCITADDVKDAIDETKERNAKFGGLAHRKLSIASRIRIRI